MKIRLIFPIGAILLILGVATCCYLQDKKNQQRVILDDKAVNRSNDISNVTVKDSVFLDTTHSPQLDSMDMVIDSINYSNGWIRIKNGKPTYPPEVDSNYIKINGIVYPGKVYK